MTSFVVKLLISLKAHTLESSRERYAQTDCAVKCKVGQPVAGLHIVKSQSQSKLFGESRLIK